MGYYKKHRVKALPPSQILLQRMVPIDATGSDFSALTATKAVQDGADVTAGFIDTGTCVGVDADTFKLWVLIDDLLEDHLNLGVRSSDALASRVNRVGGFSLGIAKVQGDLATLGATTGGLLDLNTFAQLTAGVDAVTGVAATATLTLTGLPADTQTLTVNDQTYTFLAILTDDPGNIQIPGTAADLEAAIVAALTGGAGAGTVYGTDTVGPTGVTASAGAGTTVVFTADATGVAANSYATTETMANASFGGATMSGGVAAVTAVARVVREATALTTAGPVNATLATDLNDLTILDAPLDDGIDQISFAWTRPAGTTGTSVYTYADGDTLQEIADFIDTTCMGGLTTTTMVDGKFVITNNSAGLTGLNATALVTTEIDYTSGTYLQEINLLQLTYTAGDLVPTELQSVTTGWLTGAPSATPVQCAADFTVAATGNGLVVEYVFRSAGVDTFEFVVSDIPAWNYLIENLEA